MQIVLQISFEHKTVTIFLLYDVYNIKVNLTRTSYSDDAIGSIMKRLSTDLLMILYKRNTIKFEGKALTL